jgi:hypothetical protein
VCEPLLFLNIREAMAEAAMSEQDVIVQDESHTIFFTNGGACGNSNA